METLKTPSRYTLEILDASIVPLQAEYAVGTSEVQHGNAGRVSVCVQP